jgi:arylsulfatase
MSNRPNILWLMTDEQRADSLGYTGTPWAHSPNLDHVAERGTRFSAAYTPSPVCIPARACILTGRPGSSIGVLNNHHWLTLENPRFLTWTFAAQGYQVASFGKHHYSSPRRAFDYEYQHVLGERVHYYEYKVPVDHEEAGVVRYDGGKSPWLFAGRYPGDVEDTPEMHVVTHALDWIQRRDPGRPYFLRVSFNAPHTPVVAPAPFDTLIDPEAIDLPIDWASEMDGVSATHREHLFNYAGTHRMTEAQIRRARQCYYGRTAFVDHVCGTLLDALEDRGELDHTIVAFVADHGAHLGDHGFFQKQSFWDASVRVPFFVTGPGIHAATVSTPINIGSLLPTLMDLTGIPIPPQVAYPSLASSLQTGTPPAPHPVFSEIDYGNWYYRSGERYVMIRDGRWKLSLYRDPHDPTRYEGREDRVLFDLENDPEEVHNLAHDPVYAEVITELLDKLAAWDRDRPLIAPRVVDGHEA